MDTDEKLHVLKPSKKTLALLWIITHQIHVFETVQIWSVREEGTPWLANMPCWIQPSICVQF